MTMELEYIGKLIIILIVVMVAISMIYSFYFQSKNTINDIMPGKDKNGDIVAMVVDNTASTIPMHTRDIEKYCMLCSKVASEYNPEGDAVCYIVKGRFDISTFPTNKCGEWKCDDWSTAQNAIISYDWRNSRIKVEC